MKKHIWFGLMAVGLVGAAAASEVRYVDEFDLSGSTCGLGLRTLPRQSVGGHPLTVGGKVYERGFGSHSEGAVGFRADGRIEAFDALVGVDDDATAAKCSDRQAKLLFKVWADGRIVWTSPVMQEGMRPVPVHLDLKGVREIVLETSSTAPWLAFEACHGDWLDARFSCADGTKIEAITDPAETVQLGILTPPEKPEPQINGADIWGVRPGHPVIFRIATSGVRPMKFTAKGLPEGVTLDAAKGILGGVAPERKGDYDIEVTAENAKGKAVRLIRLVVGDTIVLTSPMGWNSWNIWGENFNGEHAKAAARALDESGLGDHGWAYVNLDDFWEMNNSPQNKDRPELRGPARDAEGRILSNPSFPDMKGLTDYIHSFGFKAGLYSSPGPTTCGGCEGSYGHELQDATRWAEWGFDYVKYDWCSYDEVIKDERGGKPWYDGVWRDERGASKERPYRLMRDCLLKQNRDIVFSFCQYGMGKAEEWARDAGANCWRTWGDMKDTWPWMEKALEGWAGAENFHKFNGPGCWADPDMMLVGLQRSFGSTHPTYLTPNEQYTHVSLWCMIGSPLLIGTDLTKLDAFTKSLLVNDEVIAVSQDRLGKTARRIRHTDAESVWVRPLVGGDVAVALVNRYPFAREIKVSFEELGLSGERWVKDLWRQKCEGRHSGEYFALVPPHATKLVRMRPVDCPKCDEKRAGVVQSDEPDTRTRTYVYPKRIIWKTEQQKFDDGWPMRREVIQLEKLLEHKRGQVSEGYFGTSVGTKLVNRGEAPGVLLDFGRELHGGIQIGVSKESSAAARLRLRFGESAGEAMSTVGDGRHACNDHSVRDFELEVPRFGTIEVGNTGFRFLRIDLVTGGEVGFEFVRAVSLMRPMKAIGAFRSSDERLNRIYETGVRTVHLCCQEHLWDGIKRDRLVWIGDDSYTAMKAILPVFGAVSVVPETLDHAIATTPPEKWMVLPSYTLWFVRCLADWYRYTGDIAYLRGHADYLRKTMDHVAVKGMQPDGRWTGGDFLDWHTYANHPASLDGLQAVSAMAYDDAAFLFAALDESELASVWRIRAERARKIPVQPHGAKLSAALQVQAGMLEVKTAIDEWLCKKPGLDQSPFSSYFIADVLSFAGRQDLALPTVRNYFGAMLDMGATSFWEGFDVTWTNGATRIDEMPVVGRKEVHGDFGEFCYPGFRNSLCHSWGAGVSAWCIQRILGIRPLDVGCKTVEVHPDLGNLDWAEGALALPDGRSVRVRITRCEDGTLDVKVEAPPGVQLQK